MKSVALKVSEATGERRRGWGDDQPLRLLLVRERLGELPWVVRTITTLMEPVEVVQVGGLANALWRLGRERFDSVLLDLHASDRKTVRAWRQHIVEVAAIPLLDLNGEASDGDGLPPPDEQPDRRPRRADTSRAGARRASPSLRAVRGAPQL